MMCSRLALVLALAAITVMAATACTSTDDSGPLQIPATADPELGAASIQAFGCGTCHRIPGIAGANGRVGPSLEGFGRQLYIAGAVPNTTENLIQWLRDPDSIEPGTIMPSFGMDEETAINIAAYLNEH